MPDVGTGIATGIGALGLLSASEAGDAADEAEELYQQQARTAALSRQIGLEQWNIWKQTYLPYDRERVGMQRRLLPTEETAQRTAMEGDVADRETYEQIVAPVLNRIIDDAMAGVEDRSNYVVSRAAADVSTQFGVAREQTQRNLERRGVRPSEGAMRGGMEAGAFAEAGERARQVNLAREEESRRREDVDFQRRKEAFSLGSPMRQPRFPAGVAQAGGMQAGTGSQTLGVAARGFGQAGTGYRQLAGMYGDVAGSAAQSATDYVMRRYGDRAIMGGGGVTPKAPPALPATAGVSPGAEAYRRYIRSSEYA